MIVYPWSQRGFRRDLPVHFADYTYVDTFSPRAVFQYCLCRPAAVEVYLRNFHLHSGRATGTALPFLMTFQLRPALASGPLVASSVAVSVARGIEFSVGSVWVLSVRLSMSSSSFSLYCGHFEECAG